MKNSLLHKAISNYELGDKQKRKTYLQDISNEVDCQILESTKKLKKLKQDFTTEEKERKSQLKLFPPTYVAKKCNSKFTF